MWEALRAKYGVMSATKLRELNMRFNSSAKQPNQTMRQHLRNMSSMIRDLRSGGVILSDEQQVRAVIRSLPSSWEHMKANMTHNENAAKSSSEANAAHSSQRKTNGSKHKKAGGAPRNDGETTTKKAKSTKHKRGKCDGKKDKSKLTCHNCGATDHLARSRVGFVEYRRVPVGSRSVKIGNNVNVHVEGIGTYKLNFRSGRTLYLHDVLHIPEIRQNLLSIMVEGNAFMVSPQDTGEPRSIQEALSSLARKEWTNGMNKEMKSMRTNWVSDLVDLPPGHKTIGNMWMLKVKHKAKVPSSDTRLG
ncbi:hypothetical protein CRG98_046631 [Punica granatum]|uniref:Retrovirus-related Pol polyprotein from transposon TNT 1-94-like beta-barrel domain-containing protein n=1 Tax=Punica granatum TaxID=22663 RepID=A0A2I0HMR4_PUNGR|nr:hypothetical protein CRG98_046631 [Punica granatum]